MANKKFKLAPLRYDKKLFILFALAFAVIGTVTLLLTTAATSDYSVEPETSTISGDASTAADASASGSSYVQFNQSSGTWTWPATLANTGPAPGTTFSNMTPRNFTSADSGQTFENFQMNVGNGQEIYITGDNITFKNCKIIYTGTTHSANGFVFVGLGYDASVKPRNIVFDHCLIDAGMRHEYNILTYNSLFTIQYSQIRGGSHNINSHGDTVANTTINIYRNYIYDYHINPYAPGYDYNNHATWGHANGVYFTGNNGTVIIEDNTIIGNRWQQCTSGWSAGPGPGCVEIDGTSAVTVYAGEDPNPDKNYIVRHNQISGAGYLSVRFYGETPGIQSVQILNNVLTAQAGWPKHTIDGQTYYFDGNSGTKTISGNSWGTDTVCFSSPSSCQGSPN